MLVAFRVVVGVINAFNRVRRVIICFDFTCDVRSTLLIIFIVRFMACIRMKIIIKYPKLRHTRCPHSRLLFFSVFLFIIKVILTITVLSIPLRVNFPLVTILLPLLLVLIRLVLPPHPNPQDAISCRSPLSQMLSTKLFDISLTHLAIKNLHERHLLLQKELKINT